jgi:hypothetical protein
MKARFRTSKLASHQPLAASTLRAEAHPTPGEIIPESRAVPTGIRTPPLSASCVGGKELRRDLR